MYEGKQLPTPQLLLYRRRREGINLATTELLWHVVSICWLETSSGESSFLEWLTDPSFLGHCRRRKIRCIPAPGDAQGRCSNCIRLKKECNFYPVDQQPPPEPRRRGSKAQSGTERASESSSPSTSSGQLPEMPPTLPYPHLNMPPIQDLGGPQMKRQRTESFSPENNKGTNSCNTGTNPLTTLQSSRLPATLSITMALPTGWRLMSPQTRSLRLRPLSHSGDKIPRTLH